MKNRRVGKIVISQEFLFSEPLQIIEFFHFIGFCPFHTSVDMYHDSTEFVGVCPEFDEVTPGEMYPTYTATLHVNCDSGKPVIDGASVKKVDHREGWLDVRTMFDKGAK